MTLRSPSAGTFTPTFGGNTTSTIAYTATAATVKTALYAKMENAEFSDMLRWSQTVIDVADGDPSKGNFIFGSPLAA